MMRIPWPSILDDAAIHAARKLAVRCLEYACDGSRGRGELDLVYIRITEGRDQGAMRDKFSSCGELPHWLLGDCLGVRLPWINRDSVHGWSFENGRNNITTLYYPTINSEAEVWRDGVRFEPGDVGLIWDDWNPNNTHAFCVIDQADGVLLTAEYGQPGGALRTRAIRNGRLAKQQKNGAFKTGRRIRYRLSLAEVLRAAHSGGKLVDATDPTRAPDGAPEWSP